MPHSYIAELIAGVNPINLEIGSGKRIGSDGWLSVDMSPKCDINWDLRNGIPFPDNSVDKIYSSHFLEHLTVKEGQKFLTESFRALAPAGLFSICVPNARLYIDAYTKSDNNIASFVKFRPAFDNTGSRIDFLNYMAYMAGHHKCMIDEDSLINRLKMAGFTNPLLRQFDPNLDRQERDYESIYAVAEKQTLCENPE